MSRLSRNLLVRATIAATALALLAGCGAGQITQTSRKHSAVGGLNADVGTISIRDARTLAPPQSTWEPGSTVPLSLYLGNLGTTTDQLVSVSSPIASAVMLMPEGSALPAAQTSAGSPSDPSVATTGLGGVHMPKAPKPGVVSPATTGPSASWHPLPLPPGSVTRLALDEAVAGQTALSSPTEADAQTVERRGYVVLVGVTKQLRVGDSIAVTLRFEAAGPITLELPVSVPTKPRPRASSELEHR